MSGTVASNLETLLYEIYGGTSLRRNGGCIYLLSRIKESDKGYSYIVDFERYELVEGTRGIPEFTDA